MLGEDSAMTSRTYHISKTIDAPLQFVYDWCTDFQEDDPKITGSKSTRRILEKTSKRVVYTVSLVENGEEEGHVSIVSLKPPNSWHLDTAGNEMEKEVGDYKLSKFGKKGTKLDMVFTITFGKNVEKIPTSKQLADDLSKFWDKLVPALVTDYKGQKPGSD